MAISVRLSRLTLGTNNTPTTSIKSVQIYTIKAMRPRIAEMSSEESFQRIMDAELASSLSWRLNAYTIFKGESNATT